MKYNRAAEEEIVCMWQSSLHYLPLCYWFACLLVYFSEGVTLSLHEFRSSLNVLSVLRNGEGAVNREASKASYESRHLPRQLRNLSLALPCFVCRQGFGLKNLELYHKGIS
uniref:Uncharacterized protein n=1 Tax=Micrurus lemniscatus lemniscatus TaxID=129467 RepID=A0A2D4H5S9_MICLE